MIIELPEMIYMNTVLDKQIKLIESLDNEEEAEFSFEKVKFILPESTIILLALSKQAYLKTGKPVKWSGMRDEIRIYIERIQVCNLDFIKLSTEKSFLIRKRQTNSLVEMRIMKSANQYDEMVSETKRILYQWFPGREAAEYVKQITGYIKDIAANSLEHSEENGNGICYYTLQKYSSPKSKMSIRVAFGDTGMGIYNSLLKRYPWIEKKKKRPIVAAFIEGLSCRGNANGGLGFRMVKKQLKDYGGEIQIRSGTEMIRYYSNGRYKVVDYKYGIIGTQTLFILK